MQIQSIEIEGFWSYRDPQRIDINDLKLIVGVGDNGTGKSALLVAAIVAAFYGKFPTKTVEESITTGSAEGHVSVEFLLHGTKYRVGRRYPRTGTPKCIVQVEDHTKSSGWRAVVESGVREANEYITQLLGMDYETATMTWIAEQGQYGKFSTSLPSKRFNLLSSIFGLDVYAPRQKAAADVAAAADQQVNALTARIDELQRDLDQLLPTPDVRDGVDDEFDTPRPTGPASLSDADLAERQAMLTADIDKVLLDLADLNAADPARLTVEARQALYLVRNARLATLTTAQADLDRATVARKQAEDRAAAAKAAANSRYEQSVAAARFRAEESRNAADATLAGARTALAEIAAAEDTLPTLQANTAAQRQQAQSLRARAEELAGEVTTKTAQKDTLLAEWDKLKQDVADVQERINLLRKTTDGSHADCFTCGQHLTPDMAAALITSQEQEIARIAARQEVVKTSGKAAKDAIGALTAERSSVLAQAAAADDAAAATGRELARIEALIASKPERKKAELDAHASLARVIDEQNEAVDIAADQRAVAQAAAEATEAEEKAAADQAAAAAAKQVAASTHPDENEEKLTRALAEAETRVAADAADVAEQRVTLELRRDNLRVELEEHSREAYRRAENAAAIAEKEARIAELTAQRTDALNEAIIHKTLASAFAPTGIPAMILGGVVAELNDTINASLKHLSRGELSVELRAARETKGGSVENKVYVYVTTPTGTRAYETLSGGQKFRVDLAIRTGLANTIARGTGTPVQTFILDEGWGTLDERGILSTVDTLFRLSDDTNVITVSHVDAVRDAFPARVEVSMVGGNSVAEVVAA